MQQKSKWSGVKWKSSSSISLFACIYLICQLQTDPAEKTGFHSPDGPAQMSGGTASVAKPGHSSAEQTEPGSPKSCWSSPLPWRRNRDCCQASRRSWTVKVSLAKETRHFLHFTSSIKLNGAISLIDATAHVDIPNCFVVLASWSPWVRVLTDSWRKKHLNNCQPNASPQLKFFILYASLIVIPLLCSGSHFDDVLKCKIT